MLPSVFLKSETGNPPLRIGLLLDSFELPDCFAEVIDHILQSNFAGLELLVFNTEKPEKRAAAPAGQSIFREAVSRLINSKLRKTLLYDLYRLWDRRNIGASQDPFAPVDCSVRLERVESIYVTPGKADSVHRFPSDAIARIREKQLDVLIGFGFGILCGDILTAAKYGVWSCHYGDSDSYRGGPACFWEVLEGNPVTGVTLRILTEEPDAEKILYKGIFTTYPGISQARNLVQPHWGASTFMIQKLRELHQRGWDHVESNMLPSGANKGRKKIYTIPSNQEMLAWLGPTLLRKSLRRLVRRPTILHWRLAARTAPQLLVDSVQQPGNNGFQWIESPKGSFYADPFLIEEQGKVWVFFEDLEYASQRGRISCAEFRQGEMTEPVLVLDRPYHLSYPCIFRDGGEMYMIPETGSAETVELYRCVRFPDKWEMQKVLFRGRAVDTTLWIEDGVYWFFTTLQESRGYATQFWLFYADSLTGDWNPHPSSPISTDVRNCRGAGAIFRHNGKLYRPSQDCSKAYGYRFTLNEIVSLDRCRYKEKPCVTFDPGDPDVVATHTYSHAGQIEIIDGCARLPMDRVV